ncbi:flagellar biosynthetic protein FlhB [Humitalea rosea]|uniref:Flagellar biosynthetic protein FlhB n=1 Tax=Humitalea rosea TaxID=990373 RepID=A0A2W7I775_9PROT|nr:EscU/YscU/HrcU family type III secretion system export apparatus switch protein [Humitalea rosea]PZW41312.1 flagellar biosynthetic protein FlhB [Humitalea rosea]
MAEGEGADKTEAPSQRRLDRAQEEGQVALSKEAVGFLGLLFGAIAAATVLPGLGQDLLKGLRGILARSHELGWQQALPELAWLAFLAVAPIAGLASLGAVAATLAQTGGVVSARNMVPSLGKLSPLAGLGRILGPNGALELLRTVLKLAVVGGALWYVAGDSAPLRAAMQLGAGALLGLVGDLAVRLVAAALVVLAAIAVLDVVLVRLRHVNKLRMSRQDLKEESRESDGDPMVKGRQKAIRMQKARQRMMTAVPRASVVITNPTHYAVALAYDPGEGAAPRVVAKGADAVAARIREIAKEAGVPLVANPPLARALFRIELDQEIPAEHYQAVAEIIAFVMRARGGGAAG